MRWIPAALVVCCLGAAPARAAAPLDLGTPPTLEWG